MVELVRPGEAIEGAKVDGASRKPLMSRGLYLSDGGTQCYRFVADFDVKARVTELLLSEPETRLHPSAAIDGEAEIICQKAMVHCVSRKYDQYVGPGSATHQTNHWHFAKQTAVIIDRGHQQIIEALEKRKQLSSEK